MRRDIVAQEERSSLFARKGRGGSTSWRHKFVCLSDTEAERVPTGQSEKVVLEEAGLWEKTVCVDLESDKESFRSTILAAYPKLCDGGGFELLRCHPNSRELVVIGPKVANSPKLLKRRVGNGRVYVRPIQRNLSLEEEEGDLDVVRSVNKNVLAHAVASIQVGCMNLQTALVLSGVSSACLSPLTE